jgi:DNA-binding XRE family transcriptional regulator
MTKKVNTMTGYEFLMRMKMEGVTGSDIAEKLKISPQAIYKWTREKDKPVKIPARHWATVANILRISINEIMPGSVSLSGNVSASNGSVAQQSGGDSTTEINHNMSASPTKSQLIALIHEVATDDYIKQEIDRLLKVKKILSSK